MTTSNNDRLKTFEGAVIVITGGASGIGRAIATALADQKARAIVVMDRQEVTDEAFVSTLQKDVEAFKAYQVDVRDYKEVERVVKETKETFGRIDYMFNNAGTLVFETTEKIGAEQFDYVMDVNFRGVSNGIHAVYPILKEQGFGHIINTASMAGLTPSGEGMTAYGSSKYAIVGLSLNLRIEAARHGVRVSVLCPGFIQTDILQGGGKFGRFMDSVTQEDIDLLLEKIHPMDPDKLAKCALKLVAKNKPIIVLPGWPYKFFWFIHRRFPTLGLYLARKQNDKTVKKFEKRMEGKKQEGTETEKIVEKLEKHDVEDKPTEEKDEVEDKPKEEKDEVEDKPKEEKNEV